MSSSPLVSQEHPNSCQDHTAFEDRTGVVCYISCQDCSVTYVGQIKPAGHYVTTSTSTNRLLGVTSHPLHAVITVDAYDHESEENSIRWILYPTTKVFFVILVCLSCLILVLWQSCTFILLALALLHDTNHCHPLGEVTWVKGDTMSWAKWQYT